MWARHMGRAEERPLLSVSQLSLSGTHGGLWVFSSLGQQEQQQLPLSPTPQGTGTAGGCGVLVSSVLPPASMGALGPRVGSIDS